MEAGVEVGSWSSSLSPTQPYSESAYVEYENNREFHFSTQSAITYGENDTGHVTFSLTADLADEAQDMPRQASRNDASQEDDEQDLDFGNVLEAQRVNLEPETPATAVNPFFKRGSVMRGREMFDATQPSSVRREASPTSSRPSPNIFNDTLGNESISPAVTRLPFTKNSSSPSGPVLSALETPIPTKFSRTNRGLRNSYISVGESQERRAGDRGGQMSDLTDSDSEMSDIEPQRRSNLEIQQAKKELDAVKFQKAGTKPGFIVGIKIQSGLSVAESQVLTSRSTPIEVPSTSRQRFTQEDNSSQCPDYGAPNTQEGDTVADSQAIAQSSHGGTTASNNTQGPSDYEEQHSPGNFDGHTLQLDHTNAVDCAVTRENSCSPTDHKTSLSDATIPETSSPRSPTLLQTGRKSIKFLTAEDRSSLNTGSEPSSESLSQPLRSLREIPERVDATDSGAAQEGLFIQPLEGAMLRKQRPGHVSPKDGSISSPFGLVTATTSPKTQYLDILPISQSSEVSALSSAPESLLSNLSSPSEISEVTPIHARRPVKRKADRYPITPSRISKRKSLASLPASDDIDPLSLHLPMGKMVPKEKKTYSGIFHGMTFAVSYVAKDTESASEKAEIGRLIIEHGGIVLDDGFEPLFAAQGKLTLSQAAESLGFVALLADDFSRKAKYVQALALGLPCISTRWVASCVAKQTVEDWGPYLLAAGRSTFLGNAHVSRKLIPYPASEAALAQSISERCKLFEGQSVLLITGKGKTEDRSKAYVFLARALGSDRVGKAVDYEQARKKLLEGEVNGRPWDCLFVHDNNAAADRAVFGTGPKNSRKRSRGPSVADVNTMTSAKTPPQRIRLISDETVIQSIIVGTWLGDA